MHYLGARAGASGRAKRNEIIIRASSSFVACYSSNDSVMLSGVLYVIMARRYDAASPFAPTRFDKADVAAPSKLKGRLA